MDVFKHSPASSSSSLSSGSTSHTIMTNVIQLDVNNANINELSNLIKHFSIIFYSLLSLYIL